MGANSKQAVAVLLMLIGFTLLAGAFAGGGIVLGVGALLLLGGSAFVFMQCKPLEQDQ